MNKCNTLVEIVYIVLVLILLALKTKYAKLELKCQDVNLSEYSDVNHKFIFKSK